MFEIGFFKRNSDSCRKINFTNKFKILEDKASTLEL